MYDLLAAAYQADVTRVFTFMLSRELSQRTYPQLGVTEQHHSVSHHTNDKTKIAKNVKINTYHVELFAKFLEKLRSTPDGDGSLLDHSIILYGAGMGDPNGHNSDPLPVVMVGGGVGQGHRHIQLPKQTPVGNLWRAVAGEVRSRSMEQFGDSTGIVDGLVYVTVAPAVWLSSCGFVVPRRRGVLMSALRAHLYRPSRSAARRGEGGQSRSRPDSPEESRGGQHSGSRRHHAAALGRARGRSGDVAMAAAGGSEREGGESLRRHSAFARGDQRECRDGGRAAQGRRRSESRAAGRTNHPDDGGAHRESGGCEGAAGSRVRT